MNRLKRSLRPARQRLLVRLAERQWRRVAPTGANRPEDAPGLSEHVIDLSSDRASADPSGWGADPINRYRLLVNDVRFREAKRLLARYVDLEAKPSLADYGAGRGVFLSYLGRSGVGIDLSPEAVDRMRASGLEAYTPAEVVAAGRTFDVLVAMEVIEHADSPLAMLRELERLGGHTILVSTPYVRRTRVVSLSEQAGHDRKRPENYHRFELSTRDFESLLTHTGLTVVDRHYIHGHRGFGWWHPATWMALALGHLRPKWVIYILRPAPVLGPEP